MFRRSAYRFADKNMRQSKEIRAYSDSVGTEYALKAAHYSGRVRTGNEDAVHSPLRRAGPAWHWDAAQYHAQFQLRQGADANGLQGTGLFRRAADRQPA